MKNKILLILIFTLIGACDVCFAQTGLGTTPCNGGNNNPPRDNPNPHPDPKPADSASVRSEQPVDPNEIIGLEGYNAPESTDTLRWVSATQSLAYTIYFENDAELAMAAASKVTITVPLHDKLNYATFGVGSFGFGNHIFTVEGSPSSYQTRIDLRDSMGIYLDVVAGLDIVHNEAFWIFQSIDPATGLPPTDIHLGFLPINDSLHSGEGFVTCTIKPKAGECVTGDTVSATASIVFDVNEAIPTNTWVNTIDAFAPTSTLTITPNAAGDMLTATFEGEDDEGGCGVKQYKLYYSVNGSAYQLYNIYPVGDTAQIPVETGMEYEFFTLAEDNVGNCEPMKTQPEYNIGTNFVTLAVNAFPQEAGTVTGGGTYSVNDIAQLTATAAEGYHFVNWMSQGVPVSTNNPYSAAVSQNQTYTAYFERNAYTLQTIAATGSSITFTDLNGNEVPSGSTILHFDKLIVSTDTADCYAMESVSLNGVAYVPGDTLTVTGDIVLSAQTEPLIIQTDTTATACELFVWYGETLTETAEYTKTFTNAAGCDSVVTLHLTINRGTYTETTVDTCGNEYYWALADTTVNQSGTYYYYSTNANTCTDTAVLMLSLHQSATTELSAQICSGEVYDQNGFNVSTAGDHYLNLQTEHDCDSTVVLHLTVGSEAVTYLAASICVGDSYQENGFDIIAPAVGTHMYSDTIGRLGTCDSIVHLTLTVNHGTYVQTTVDTCGTEFYWALADTTINQSGTYYYYSTNANTCIDTTVLMLSLYQSVTTELSAQICAGEVYDQNGFNVSTAGDHYLNLQTEHGCDSTVVLHLTVGSEAVTYLAASICEGESYQENGFEIIAPAVGTHMYSDTIGRTGTCDSIVHLTLTVNRGTYAQTTVDTCGSEYYWALADTTLNQSGTYYYFSNNANTCIDTTVLMLALYQSTTTEFTAQICAGEVYDQNGFNVSTAGDHYLSLQTVHGCDSTVILHLTVGSEAVTYLAASICEGENYTDNGFAIVAPEVGIREYSDTIHRQGACDSIVVLHLTVNTTTYGDTTAVACDSFTWHDSTYTSSGSYQSHLSNAAGCDSIVTLHLTITQPTYGDTTAVACDSFTWHGITYTSSGSYQSHLSNAAGCDSTVTLHLTVNHGNYAEVTVDTCGTEFFWDVSGQSYDHSDTYYHYSTNANACQDTTVLVLTLQQAAVTELAAQICEGEVYDQNGFNVSTAGDHHLNLQTAHGCDSTVILHLAVGSEAVTYLSASICEGENYTDNGFAIIAPEAGVSEYRDTIHRQGACDSIVVFHLTINQPTYGDTAVTACDSFTWHDRTYTSSGSYQSYLTNTAGCDSIVTLHLIINHGNYAEVTVDTCGTEFFWEVGGQSYDHSDTYYHYSNNANGCQDTTVLVLTLHQAAVTELAAQICVGEVYDQNGFNVSTAGDHYLNLQTAHGCDSTVILHLAVGSEAVTNLSASICEGENYTDNGFAIVAPEVGIREYSDTIHRQGACDSIVVLHLTVNTTTYCDTTVTACDSFTWHDITYTSSGSYQSYLSNAAGCDSIVTLHLTVNHGNYAEVTVDTCGTEFFWEASGQSYYHSDTYYYYGTNANACQDTTVLILTLHQATVTELSAQICEGEVYDQNGFNASTAGQHYLNLQTEHGCDSTVILHLSVGSEAVTYLAASICEGDSYQENGFEIIAPSVGTYMYSDTIARLGTCDSVISLTLTVNSATYGDTTAVVNSSFDWYGQHLTTSGDYTSTLTNAAGCDSVVTLHLIVNYSSTGDTTAIACDRFDWYEHTNLTQSGEYMHTFTNIAGGDSVVTLHLTVNHSVTEIVEATACDSYTWNGITYTQSVNYTQTFTNASGCDSTITLHLTINHSVAEHIEATACDSFTWHGITYTSSGSYQSHLTNAAGCDSIVTLHLTINQPTYGDTTIIACDSFTWHDITYTSSGSYQSHLTNAAGCDSTFTLHLTLVEAPALQAISGETAVCINQFATYYYDASDPDYHYRWFKDNALWAENVSRVMLHEMGEGSVLLTMQVSDNQYGCLADTSLTVQVLNHIAPDTTEIRRKANSNILVCAPVTSEYGQVHYRWGYTDIHTGSETVMPGDRNYCLYNIGIDTLSYRYWVETYLSEPIGEGCDNRSYYGRGVMTSTSDYDADIVEAYMSNNCIVLNVNALSPSNITATLYDVNGKHLLMREYGTAETVSDIIPVSYAPGVYFLKVMVGNQLYAFKLLKI